MPQRPTPSNERPSLRRLNAARQAPLRAAGLRGEFRSQKWGMVTIMDLVMGIVMVTGAGFVRGAEKLGRGQESWTQDLHGGYGSNDRQQPSRGASKRPVYMEMPTLALPPLKNDEDFPWTGAGGKWGLSSDWREAISIPTSTLEPGPGVRRGATMRGEGCMINEKQEEVRQILERRDTTPATSKVAACVRTKDNGRFLPEWIAYHKAIGVDEITIYDDDSVDNTKEVLQPFIDAGIVRYVLEGTGYWLKQMVPLNHCLEEHFQRRLNDSSAPRWLLFHDTDEYLLPLDTNVTISQALDKHRATCCVRVPRVMYGSGGHDEMPRGGLLLEVFLTHAHVHNFETNRLPKVMVNLETTEPSLGTAIPHLKSMHNGQGCACDVIPVTEMRINHYLGSRGDYRHRTKNYWMEVYSREKVEKGLAKRDANEYTSDTITSWACATREILSRILEGFYLKGGNEPLGHRS